jgi:hypothetical protein
MSKILRFPLENYSADLPWLLFTAYNVDYSFSGNITVRDETKDEIALYMPTNYTVNDTLAYTSARGGWVEGAAQTFGQVDTLGDLASRALGVGGAIGAAVARSVGQAAVDAITPGSDVSSLFNRSRGRVMNPNQFSLFESPQLRSFSFNFKMIPQSEQEANAIPEIIKKFRMASYPDLDANGIEFLFPKIFKIKIVNNDNIIKMPYVACESVGVVYNPSSMSYFRYENTPSEIDLTLSFKELRQLTKQQISEGF